MRRHDMINVIGADFLVSNIENGEFSYPKAFKKLGLGKKFEPIKSTKTGKKYEKLDIRFVKGNISVLIETKDDFEKDVLSAEEQLSAYVEYEKKLTGNKVIAILANTSNDKIKVWRGVISDNDFISTETVIKNIDSYLELYTAKVNDKEKVMKNTHKLNDLLHRYGIKESLRSQFVGTCLLALKNGLEYDIKINPGDVTGLSVSEIEEKEKEANKRVCDQIINGIKKILETLLTSDLNKAKKVDLLDTNILGSQDIKDLDAHHFKDILRFIEQNILPFINDKSTAGQDLLNLFFITFNKYVGKKDKNQAFTPDHITDFMAKITGVNKNTVVLDPCCGSGAFLVRAMTQALDDCASKEEQELVKKNHIFGIEYDENVYGLATTNMLIHGDGNSNIECGNCFNLKQWIKAANPDIILMNPPYNAQKKHLPSSYIDNCDSTKKEDPTRGLYFVKYIADIINELGKQAKLAVVLPVACAIGSEKEHEIRRFKKEILEKNTLDAVFTFPDDLFHPGASVSTCCMVFTLGKKHADKSNPKTYFGYYKDDGFIKKKNLGRVEQVNSETGQSLWSEIENQWIELYTNRQVVDGLSAVQKVTGDDEWLYEAYVKTDYSQLTDYDFKETLNNYLAYLIKDTNKNTNPLNVDTSNWKKFTIEELFPVILKGKCQNASALKKGNEINYIGAKRKDNGVMKRCKYYPDLTSSGNCIIMIGSGQGSSGYSIYMDKEFIGAATLSLGYASWINQYTGTFVATILCQEYDKYSHGRSWTGDRLLNTEILLPAKENGAPDFEWMENYIKSLPYADRL